jgi:NADH:ubiquinone reductase (non-electrogenic)
MTKKDARVVIVGGGFGGLFTGLDLMNETNVTLISHDDRFLFTPMLYEYLSGEVEAWQIAPYYRDLTDNKLRFIKGDVSNVDFDAREVTIQGRDRKIAYDILVLAVGSTTNYWNIEGAEKFSLPFRTIADADALRQKMIDAIDQIAPDMPADEARRRATFAVVGGGASGVELSTKMADLLRDAFRRRGLQGEPRLIILEMAQTVVPGMGDDLREYVEQALKEKQVEVRTQTRVLRVMENSVTVEHDGKQEEIQAVAVVWTAGVKVNPLIEKLNVEKDKKDLISVADTLQLKHHPEVFALGDIAHYANADKEIDGTAQLATQEAVLCSNNIRAFLKGDKLKTKHFKELGEALSLGTTDAAVRAAGQAFGGALARDARFALYTARMPTWHHRLKVGASWFFEGTKPRPLGLYPQMSVTHS